MHYIVIRWKIRRDTKSIYATPFGIFSSVIIVVLFLWTIWSEFEVAEEPRMNLEYYFYNTLSVFGGVLTVLLGVFFLAVGFPILADLFMEFDEHFRIWKKSGIPQDAGGKMKTICIICRTVVSLIAMLMLLWAISTGFKLISVPREVIHYPPVSRAISIMFGICYIIVGLCTIVKLAVGLMNRLQEKLNNAIVIHQVHNIEINSFV